MSRTHPIEYALLAIIGLVLYAFTVGGLMLWYERSLFWYRIVLVADLIAIVGMGIS